MLNCLHCGNEFEPRKAGHVFCCVPCRHGGERPEHERVPVDHGAVDRLFDLTRDPGELVRDDDWFTPANATAEHRALYACDTIGTRRAWYLNLAPSRRRM